MSASEIVLWVGPKHSGKTSAASDMVERIRTGGYSVRGILAPSLYRGDRLVGFDVIDLFSDHRAPLLRLGRPADVGSFAFREEGLRLGRSALAASNRRPPELIVVDEFGPLELTGRGWRDAVDRLIGTGDSLLLLIVREDLCAAVCDLYGSISVRMLPALEPDSTASIERLLSDRRARNRS